MSEAELRIEIDEGVRSFDDGRTLLGGSPLRIVRVTAAGAALVERWRRGEPVSATPAHRSLARRLVDGGLAHPRWSTSPFTPADVTVVIPVRDDADRLAATVEAVAGVGAVVVVDDGSTEPAAIGRSAGEATVVRRPTSGGPAAARNEGLRTVETPLVAFVDADCVPAPGWLDHLLPHLVDDRVGAVAPRVRSAPGTTLLERYEDARSPLDLGGRPGRVALRTALAYVPTACLLCRREVPTFDERLRFGEDVDLVWRLVEGGAIVRYDPSTVVDHGPRTSWRDWWRQRRGYGSAAAPLARRHPGAVAPVVVSRWSALAWSLVALRRPLVGVAVAVVSAALLPRKLRPSGVPQREAVGLALRGHAAAGRHLAEGVRRTWWPIALAGGVLSGRVRPALVAAALVPVAAEWVERRPSIDPLRYVGLRLADDVAYGTGVWRGCITERSIAALRPDLSDWPGRSDPADAPSI
ncbi:MAG: mycofactocin biosynthesis glycosyltransferase MftF [Actinomycetota bacterium]